MSKRLPYKVKQMLNKAIDSALLAVEVYNKPATKFKSGGFIVLMSIAWTSLFHAIFIKNKVKPIYREKNGRFKRIKGDLQFWELNTCVAKYFQDGDNPIRKNIEFFIPLRNKIEHTFMPELDINIFGECQSLLLNFDSIIEKEFGEEYRLRESLTFALQLFPTSDALTKSVETTKDSEAVMKYINNYRASISTDVMESGQYSFKAFLVQVANHDSKDAIPIQFYKYDQMTDEEKANVKRIAALIKTKEKVVKVFSTKDLLKPGKVVKKVQQGLGNPKIERYGKNVDKFNSDTHTRCWKKYQVRPDSGSDHPEDVKSEYCVYDEANECYLYTEKWVNFLINKMQDEEEYNSLYL